MRYIMKYISNNTLIPKIKEITGSDLSIIPLRIGAKTKQSILEGGKLTRLPSSSGVFQV